MAELKLHLKLEGNTQITERSVSVDKDEFVIGRLPECDVYVPLGAISRQHARLFKSSHGTWFLEDLGSKNGTRLNDRLITSPQPVNHGDVIKMGQASLNVMLTKDPALKREDIDPLSEGVTILRSAEDLQQQWIEAANEGDAVLNSQKAIARLKDLVNIAKGLNSAESIEEIFKSVQEVVFRDLESIDRLALLIDVQGNGKLELLNAAARNGAQQKILSVGSSWISRSICQKVFVDKVAIKTADAQIDSRFEGEHSILAKGIRSALAVPLWDENKIVGVLYADANLSFNHWTKGGDEDLSFFSALGNLVASSVQRWLLTRKLRSEETIRQKLERYHSPAVVQQMMAVGALSNGRLTPVEREISILFADIVGFTPLSERLSPKEIAQLLNAFFEEMLQEIFAVGGTLDKFIGDCIMAFFGAPELQLDHADRAMVAAWGMLKRLDHLNANHMLQEPLQLRIAINSGKAVVGDVGSSQRVDYTALGSTINLAARMESMCPPGQCVISETTYMMLTRRQGLEEMGEYNFKGIDRPVRIYHLNRP